MTDWKAYKATAPRHYVEGLATQWQLWWAWRPVQTEQGRWVWLRWMWRRRFTPPLWFCPPAPYDGWIEYSDDRLGFWEETTSEGGAAAVAEDHYQAAMAMSEAPQELGRGLPRSGSTAGGSGSHR